MTPLSALAGIVRTPTAAGASADAAAGDAGEDFARWMAPAEAPPAAAPALAVDAPATAERPVQPAGVTETPEPTVAPLARDAQQAVREDHPAVSDGTEAIAEPHPAVASSSAPETVRSPAVISSSVAATSASVTETAVDAGDESATETADDATQVDSLFKLLGIEPVVVWSAPSAPAAEAWQAPAEPALEPVPARITLANPGLPPPPGSGVAMPAAGQAAATDVTSDAPVSADLLRDAAGDVITADGQDRSRDAQMASAETRKVVTQRMLQSGVTEVPADSAGVVAAPMSAAAPLPAVLPKAAVAPPQPPLPLAEPDAAELLGERIDWLVADGAEEATIELHPAELGALSVRIQTRGDQAQVQFIVQDPATRQLLQQALPQLRELLGSSGIQLSRSRVETQSGRAVEAPETRAEPTVSRHRRVTGVVLVDAYI